MKNQFANTAYNTKELAKNPRGNQTGPVEQIDKFRINLSDETGAQTAEYGIVTLAAVGFAGLLAVVVSSGAVQGLLQGLIEKALSFG